MQALKTREPSDQVATTRFNMMPQVTANEQTKNLTTTASQKALVVLCALGTVFIVWRLMKYSSYGFDFTDESFYLVWMANPFLYEGSVTQFGFVYHPLYWLLGGDIAALRQANILTTFGLAWGLTYLLLGSLASNLKAGQLVLLVVSAALATSALILFDSWLPTPSYNSLNLQALLITSTGLVLAEKASNHKSILGWILIGIGGWLTFMAKPTSAIGLALGVFLYLVLARKISIRLFLLAALCALASILISALIIDGSVEGFIRRIQLGMEFSEHLGGGHTLNKILRIDEFQIGEEFKNVIYLISGVLFVAIWSFWVKNPRWSFIGFLVSLLLFAFTASMTFDVFKWMPEFGRFQGLLIFSVVFGAMLAALLLGRIKGLQALSAEKWTLAVLFLLMPYIYAFGTNNNYWQAATSAGVFWLLAGITLLGPLIYERASWFLVLPLAFATQAATVTLLQTGLEQPYRQPQPLRLNATVLEIGPKRSALTISEDYAKYINSAVTVTQKAGFKQNTALIDLSGQSPGILFALGATSLGQAWTLGGYPGSMAFVKAGLSRFSCEEISQAWVLFEPEGPRTIPKDLMNEIGADFPVNYDQVGSWLTAKGAGGYRDRRVQELYRPRHEDKTLMACNKLRHR